MRKLFLLPLFFISSVVFAQTKVDSVGSFGSTNGLAKYNFSKVDNYLVNYQKYMSVTIPYSIYNPKPGFNPTKMESQKYYSFKNTNLLLRRQMSDIKSEPIFPDQEKRKTVGESIFEGVFDAVFNKKSK